MFSQLNWPDWDDVTSVPAFQGSGSENISQTFRMTVKEGEFSQRGSSAMAELTHM